MVRGSAAATCTRATDREDAKPFANGIVHVSICRQAALFGAGFSMEREAACGRVASQPAAAGTGRSVRSASSRPRKDGAQFGSQEWFASDTCTMRLEF
jgi:hypothetical protein